MSSLYKRYKTDQKREDGGVWVDLGDGVKFRLRRYKSKIVQDEKRRLEKPYENQIRRGEDLSEDIAKKLIVEQMARAICVDWQGVEDEEGNALEFSVSNAVKLFDELPDLTQELLSESLSRDRFKAQADEDAGKN